MDEFLSDIRKMETEYDECSIRGICSIKPEVTAVKASVFGCLKELTFYIKKLREAGIYDDTIRDTFFTLFSILITNFEYSEENLAKILFDFNDKLTNLKNKYREYCLENNISPIFYKTKIKIYSPFKLSDLIKQGQKYENNFKKQVSEEQFRGFELVLSCLKSIGLYLIELQSLGVDITEYYDYLISACCEKERADMTKDDIISVLNNYSKFAHKLMSVLFDELKKSFGDFIETEVSASLKRGKALLVAGSNLKELQLILEATKDKGIDVYTHGQMITGHTLSEIKKYSHLVGHYGKGSEFHFTDFSNFPGVILLTNLSLFKVEDIYTSKFFTTNKIAPKNTIKIENNNFGPLIEAVLSHAENEEEGHPKTIKAGLVEQDFFTKIEHLKEKINKGKIKNVFTIGVSNNTDSQFEYFEKFFKLLDETCFSISADYSRSSENMIFSKTDYTFPFLYKILDIILPLKETTDLKVFVLTTRCNYSTIPNLIYLKSLGVNDIYYHKCSPLLINPSIMDLFAQWFDIKTYTTPDRDLNNMLKK